MKYRIAIGLIAIVTLIAIYDHGARGVIAFNESSYFLATYNWAVTVVLFLFAAGYVSKLEKGFEESKK